jgi:hypothetical protein
LLENLINTTENFKNAQAKPSQAKPKLKKKRLPSHLTHSPTCIHTYLNKQTKERRKKKEEAIFLSVLHIGT